MSLSTQFHLQQPPLCLLASPGSCIYAIYPKRVVTYTESIKTAQFILNEPIKHWSLHSYSLFICYQSNKVERRELFSWEDPVDLGEYKDVQKLKAKSQREVTIVLKDSFVMIELMDNQKLVNRVELNPPITIQDICCRPNSWENPSRLPTVFIQESSCKLSKFQVEQSSANLKKSKVMEREIIYIELITFPIEMGLDLEGRDYLLVVDSLLKISLFFFFDQQFIPKLQFDLKGLGFKTLPSAGSGDIHIHYNIQYHTLYIQLSTNLYSIVFLPKQKILLLPIISHYLQSYSVQENIEGVLVCSNKEGPVFQNGLRVYQVKKMSSEEEIMSSIIKEKERITEDIYNYSKKMHEVWNSIPIDRIDVEEDMGEGSETERLVKEDGSEDYHQIEEEIKNFVQEDLDREHDEEPNTEPQIGANTQSRENIESNIGSMREFQRITLEEIEIQPQPKQTRQAQIQTQDYIPFDLSLVQQQVDLKISKFVQILNQQLQIYHQKVQSQIDAFKSKTTSTIQQLIKRDIPRDIKSYINQLFAPKIQRYVNLTFTKLREIIEDCNNLNIQEISKERIREAEVNRHIMDKNKEIVEKMVNVMRVSVGKFEDKKQEMISDFESKSNLLNDLTLQVEEFIKKFSDQAKEETKMELQERIEVLVSSVGEASALVKKKIECLSLPPVPPGMEPQRVPQYPYEYYPNPSHYQQSYQPQNYGYNHYQNQSHYSLPIPSPTNNYVPHYSPPQSLPLPPPPPPPSSYQSQQLPPPPSYQYQPQQQQQPTNNYPSQNYSTNAPAPGMRTSMAHSTQLDQFSQPQLYRQLSNPQSQLLNQSGFMKLSNQSMFKSKLSHH